MSSALLLRPTAPAPVPTARPPATAHAARPAAGPDGAMACPRPRPVVLVVDDDDTVRKVVSRGLARSGFDVLAASGGREAVDLVRRRGTPIDLVLLDVRMPGMDGPETLAALRKLDPSVRAFFMTGDPGAYTPEDLLGLGARRVFAKPVPLAELADGLWTDLREPDRGGPARPRTERPAPDHRWEEERKVIAHEFRNPLATIRMGLFVLRQSPVAENQARTLTTLERQVGVLARLIDDLATGSRLIGEDVRVRPERTDLRAALAAALEAGRPLVEAAGHTLAVRLPDGPLPADIDGDRFTQVIANLLGNAAKYTDAGGRVEVGLARDGGEARIWVADTGAGIPPDLLEHVFEPFVRGRPGQGRDGLGIGLAVVRHLVEAHGGTVRADSDGPGRGSTFTVRLPLAGGG